MRPRISKKTSLLTLALSLGSSFCVAQTTASSAPNAATTTPTPTSAPVPAAEPVPGPTESAAASDSSPENSTAASDPYAEAKQRVARGEALFEQGNFDAALTEFERARETMAGHPARYLVLYNIGQCLEKLYRYDGAIDAYRAYLQEGGAAAEDAPTVKAKMDVLEGLLGRVALKISQESGAAVPSYEVWVDGRRIGESLTSISLPSGTHAVEIRARGFTVEKKEVELPARSERHIEVLLHPLAKEYEGLSPSLFYTATGLAAATAVAGGVFGILALSERSRIDSELAKGPPDALLIGPNDRNKVEQLAMGADIFFISAGVFAAGAVALGFMTNFNEPNAEKTTATRAGGANSFRLRPSMHASQTSLGLSLGGSF